MSDLPSDVLRPGDPEVLAVVQAQLDAGQFDGYPVTTEELALRALQEAREIAEEQPK